VVVQDYGHSTTERNYLLEFASRANSPRIRDDLFGRLEILTFCNEILDSNSEKADLARRVKQSFCISVPDDLVLSSFYPDAI